jgi:hypothetical protein
MKWIMRKAKFPVYITSAVLLITAYILLYSSCNPYKQISKTIILEEETPAFLIQKLNDNEFHCNWINGKASVNVIRNNENIDFSIVMRMRTDSVIWLSISPGLAVEAVRVLIMRDTVKFMNKFEKKYWVSDFKYLNKIFQIPVTFEMLQAVILGNYFSYLDETKPRSAYVDNQYYLLSNLVRKKKLRSEEDVDLTKKIIQDIWLSPENYRIAASVTQDHKVKVTCDIRYSDFKQVESKLFPFHSNIILKADKPFNISVEYSKVSVNKPLEFPFNIPDNYEKMR